MSLFQSSFSPSASAFIIINVSLGGYASNHHMRMDKPLASSKNDPCFFLAKFGAYTILWGSIWKFIQACSC
ncbi:hypothetical protein L211DRAFT_319773 [Terfezia boudieri ATCC MYA-4762]|uniref:Uncharacterized protein n=1 Tax=Terfezia boudieri ATCC MYA-4762 TaxID=1051890 RepID=A0A3N4LII0_9PEZI|nr:hypothetical protein L211DRAFT_319773 [Terfezia boudieri ATCC MYA-4762]